VADSFPIYRRGLRGVCEDAGLEVVELEGCGDSPAKANFAAVVAVLRHETDWELLRVCAKAYPIVAVISSLETSVVELAVAAGAVGVIAECGKPEEAVNAIAAALEGKTLLPSRIVREIVHEMADSYLLSAAELEWLRGLVAGLSVGQLDTQAGYSEREMHRHLTKLYARLGVRNRREALSYAERTGLIG